MQRKPNNSTSSDPPFTYTAFMAAPKPHPMMQVMARQHPLVSCVMHTSPCRVSNERLLQQTLCLDSINLGPKLTRYQVSECMI